PELRPAQDGPVLGEHARVVKEGCADCDGGSERSIGGAARREQYRDEDVGVEDESHPRRRRSARVARTSAAISLRERRRRLRVTSRWIASTAARSGLPAFGPMAAANSRAASASVAPRARTPGRAGSRATYAFALALQEIT